MDLNQRFPGIADMEIAAKKRMPRFSWDYLAGGIGRNIAIQNNIEALNRIQLQPRYLVDHAESPNLSHNLLGQSYRLPFGVAPIGLSGLIWPRASEHLAMAAKSADIPFALSGFATSSIEQIGDIGGRRWYQHYAINDDDINQDLLKRAQQAGFETLIITVDIPTSTRRDHNIRNGLSVPPHFNLRTLKDIIARPRWALEMLKHGVPEFLSIKPYLPKNASLQQIGVLLGEMIEGHVSLGRLKKFRDLWPGTLIVKGLLDPEDALRSIESGADAVVISNHGGRQLDAAQAAVELIPEFRKAVGDNFPLIIDGGIRSGLDIARSLAMGADFVLCGKAFMFAIGAMGPKGGHHAIDVLYQELRSTMGQLGCPDIAHLPQFLRKK
jgi:isopentenyl diphosphate isomerase/L-lactate dehydrogenase-like FMN-dependent dehydrogenase